MIICCIIEKNNRDKEGEAGEKMKKDKGWHEIASKKRGDIRRKDEEEEEEEDKGGDKKCRDSEKGNLMRRKQ